VDVHDALVTERPYKPAFPVQAAVDTLRRETDAGSWDPRIVDTWLDLVRSGAVYTSTAGSNRITT
jgi:HD-GYP domain-containing protein (c-di-GMP phosphodiesterase class II)